MHYTEKQEVFVKVLIKVGQFMTQQQQQQQEEEEEEQHKTQC